MKVFQWGSWAGGQSQSRLENMRVFRTLWKNNFRPRGREGIWQPPLWKQWWEHAVGVDFWKGANKALGNYRCVWRAMWQALERVLAKSRVTWKVAQQMSVRRFGAFASVLVMDWIMRMTGGISEKTCCYIVKRQLKKANSKSSTFNNKGGQPFIEGPYLKLLMIIPSIVMNCALGYWSFGGDTASRVKKGHIKVK